MQKRILIAFQITEKSIDTFIPIKNTTVTSYVIVQGFRLQLVSNSCFGTANSLPIGLLTLPFLKQTNSSLDTNFHSGVPIFDDLIHINSAFLPAVNGITMCQNQPVTAKITRNHPFLGFTIALDPESISQVFVQLLSRYFFHSPYYPGCFCYCCCGCCYFIPILNVNAVLF